MAKIKLGLGDNIQLGNLDSERDWGFAGDFVEAMWLMLQQDNPDNYVVATGETHSVKDFLKEAFEYVGIKDWEPHVTKDPQFIRPAELYSLKGNFKKAQQELGWTPSVRFKRLVQMMVEADITRLKQLNH